jgi:hypothetical protein
MTKLLEKNKAFEWTTECQASFEEPRKRLNLAPVLVLPNLTKKFKIYCDASRRKLGCVFEGPEKATRGGGEWEPIKNSSTELGIYPKIDLMPLSANLAKAI